ncbi:hypothetical protein ACVU7I_16680, partial [Patulibacter sp. S7RM1-6]
RVRGRAVPAAPPVAMTTAASVGLALAVTVALVVVHLLAPRLRALPGIPERRFGSFAGGIAVAYVFLHLLPELVEGNEALGEALADVVPETPLLDLAIFTVALAGLVAFYGLERLADGRAARRPDGDPAAGGGPQAGAASGGEGERETEAREGDGPAPVGGGVFALHLGSFAVYNALITYTMPLRLRTGVDFALLFAVAMALHFVLTDRGMEEHYDRRFRRVGRPVLAAALLVGWALSAALAPTSTVVVALLTAFLGGSILLNVFKEELPAERRSSFGAFLAGVVLYGALLAAVTATNG